MNISSQQDVDAVNAKFSRFHDGFIKSIAVTSQNEFMSHQPWEPAPGFSTNEEELLATGLHYAGPCAGNHQTIDMELHHYNYDWPRQPRTRAIRLHAGVVTAMVENLASLVGTEVFCLLLEMRGDDLACVLTYHEHIPWMPGQENTVRECTMENGHTVTLFTAKDVELTETTWAEQPTPPYSEPEGRPFQR